MVNFYKRTVKADHELKMAKEVIIKNYRLQIVDGNKDLSELDRKLFKHSLGSSILVSNSLIKPEIFKFTTKVTSELENIYANSKDPTKINEH